MGLHDIPIAVREWCDFHVGIHVGGGLGDVAHHFKSNPYFRIARDVKRSFPNLSIIVRLESKLPDLCRAMFDNEPWCDEVVTAQHRDGDWTWKEVDRFMREGCRMTPEMIAERMPQFDRDVVFRRVVNRICELARFPRVRAISMDDFFQQMNLSIDEFEWELATIRHTAADEVEAEQVIEKASATNLPIVMIHAITADPNRTCYTDRAWRRLVAKIVSRDHACAIFGGPADEEMFEDSFKTPGVIRACFDGKLGVKVALLKRCKGVVCVDGGLMSLSWLHAIPTITFMSRSQADAAHNHTVSGYHWAHAADEPFAHWHVVEPSNRKTTDPDVILDTLFALSHTKGVRHADCWGDQCQT